jgi:adenylate/nucleoside-diphosphate kinase
LAVAKEHLGEELCKEISGLGEIDTVAIRIRAEIDPYFVRADNPEDVRVTADLSEEDKRLPKGDFGDYCPVTYVKDGWLAKGDP